MRIIKKETGLFICKLVAAIAASLLLACDCDETPTGPQPTKSVWEYTPTPDEESSVNDIYMLSATDGWAVSCMTDTAMKGHGEIWRWDGTRWRINATWQPKPPYEVLSLTQVWFNGGADGWIAGTDHNTYGNASHSRMWHYDGSSWKEVAIPEVHSLTKLWFNGPDDGWAFGGDYALKWDGSTWNLTTFPTLYWTGCFFWSANDGWATSMGSIYRWDGSSWTLSYTADSRINCIGFATPTNGWALGESLEGGGRAWHWDGSSWKQFERWDNLRYDAFFEDIAFSRAVYGWAVGNNAYFWNGSTWKAYHHPNLRNTYAITCQTVFIVSETDVWVGGDGYGAILHFKGFGDQERTR